MFVRHPFASARNRLSTHFSTKEIRVSFARTVTTTSPTLNTLDTYVFVFLTEQERFNAWDGGGEGQDSMAKQMDTNKVMST